MANNLWGILDRVVDLIDDPFETNLGEGGALAVADGSYLSR